MLRPAKLDLRRERRNDIGSNDELRAQSDFLSRKCTQSDPLNKYIHNIDVYVCIYKPYLHLFKFLDAIKANKNSTTTFSIFKGLIANHHISNLLNDISFEFHPIVILDEQIFCLKSRPDGLSFASRS